MNLKKAVVASMIVSSLLVTLAGPTFVGAETAGGKKQEQASSSSVQIDKKVAAKLQKAVQKFAGKDVKLQNVGELVRSNDTMARVQSVDGVYQIFFDHKTGKVWTLNGKTTIDKISKKDQDDVLKLLKKMYSGKTYALDKEVILERYYDDKKEQFSQDSTYLLKGKGFEVSLVKNDPDLKDYINRARIEFAKEELEAKLLTAAEEAVKTVLDHQFNITEAYLVSNTKKNAWELKDGSSTLYVDEQSGKATNLFHNTRKKVTTSQTITAKEAKEVAAPLAKELFSIDITGYEVKWNSLYQDYCFVKDQETKVRVALDANKKVVYLKSGANALFGGEDPVASRLEEE
ncbi:hypothetical protein M3661_24930 [Paenibacillus sp. MER 180]|uniref:hypothetical protein n=1 Tax=Paenibacillus sp. MER 180 TaxID=2939570 RepID=UPI00203AF7AF|nr:hypothetical protein [Paenibacillus sp. MER 180]MCM3293355.1 hypothetical protein [Paenibacillus sp. MER 180]